MAGEVLGMAHTRVTPPARAAAVPEEKSSLCVAPGSRRCTCTSIRPNNQPQRFYDSRTNFSRQEVDEDVHPDSNGQNWSF